MLGSILSSVYRSLHVARNLFFYLTSQLTDPGRPSTQPLPRQVNLCVNIIRRSGGPDLLERLDAPLELVLGVVGHDAGDAASALTGLVDTEPQRTGGGGGGQAVHDGLDQGQGLLGRQALVGQDVPVPAAGAAEVCILAPGLAAAGHQLLEQPALYPAPQRLAVGVIAGDVERAEALVTQAELWDDVGACSFSCRLDRASADGVAADAGSRLGEAIAIVDPEMRPHVSEPDDLVAEMAFRRSCAVGQFMRREARQQNFWVREGWVFGPLLRDNEVAELAEDFFPGAG